MHKITNDQLRALGTQDLASLKENAKRGDRTAICKMAMCILYAQAEDSEDDMQKYLSSEEVAKDEMALLLRGYAYEHAIGTTKNYAKAVECYSKAYDLLNNIQSSGKEVKDGAKALQEIEKRYDKLTKNVGQVISVKKFCQFKDGQFLFPWTDETRISLGKLLPQLGNDVAVFGDLFAKAITNLKNDTQGEWEFRYQDTLLVPVEVMKTLAARDYFEHYLKENGFQIFPTDPYFNNALGRCLIDDEDAYDNDYIISGLLNMAGHEGDALWQYRVGLWYEYCDNNLEPKTAAYWYEQARNGMSAAKIALERVKGSLQYRILENTKEGTAKECQSLMNRSSKNPQNSVSWLIEKALRGDESAMQRIEHNQFAPKGNTSVFNQQLTSESIQPFYTLLKQETSADKKVKKDWDDLMKKEKDEYRKHVEEEERRRKEEERKRLEAERKAEEERIRKIKEAEEAKRKAEEEAIRKAKKAEEERIRKEKEAEEAKRRAEEERRREISLRESRRIAAEEERRDKQASQFLSLIGFGIGLPLILIITMFIIRLFSEDYSFSFLTYLGIFAFSSIIGCFAIREDHDLVRPQLYGIIGIMAVILVILLWRGCSGLMFGSSDDELKEKYDSVYVAGDDGLRIVSLNGKKGLIDKRGNEKFPLQYDEIHEPVEKEIQITVKNGDKEEQQTWIFTTRIVTLSGKKGLIRTGEKHGDDFQQFVGVLFEPKYDSIYYDEEIKNWVEQQ